MKTKIKIINLLYLSLLLISGVFILPTKLHATASVVINEVAWMGTTISANHEWIELYNPTAADIELTGWVLVAADGTPSITLSGTILAQSFFLLERTSDDTVPGVAADQIYTGALGNSGERLELQDTTGTLVEVIDHSSGWAAGDNSTKQTMERVSLTSSTFTTSIEVEGTPKAINGVVISEQLPPQPPQSSSLFVPPSEPQEGEVVINELVADPADGGQEWVELYNRSDRIIDLNDWTITEGSVAVTKLAGSLGTHDASRYAVFYAPKGNLNNSGDIIILKFKDKIIDQVSYGNWNDGNLGDNAPAASDPLSIGRLPNGVDTNSDANDFSKTTATPGSPNKLAAAADEPIINLQEKTGNLSFNELYPNPPLGDLEQEFIELINLSADTVNLEGWTIADDITTYTVTNNDFASTFINPSGIFLLPRPITKIALNNSTNEKITLSNPAGKTFATVSYKSPAPKEVSWTRTDSDEWLWSTIVTPGKPNIISPINKPPIIYWELPDYFKTGEHSVFDASDSVDPNGDALAFLWDFGDGYTTSVITPTHIYEKAGKYLLKLTITDTAGAVSEKIKTITVTGDNESNNIDTGTISKTNSSLSYYINPDKIKLYASRTKVQTSGTVAVKPGLFGQDLFLAGSGIQLYLQNGEWPLLTLGDKVSAAGTVSKTKSYGTRVLIKQGTD
ncbi:MAG: lamin tail domain-containing protein, partial [Patescibacteria group bacterium]